jgi:hypothetical protein
MFPPPPISGKLSGLGELFRMHVGLSFSLDPSVGGRYTSTQPVTNWLTLIIIYAVTDVLIYLVSYQANQVGI